MLRNPAGFAAGHVRRTDGVKQCGFTMVDVAHNGHDRRTFLQICFLVNLFQRFETVFFNRNLHFDLNAEISRKQQDGIDVELLVDRCHHTKQDQFFNNFGSVLVQQFGGFANRHRTAYDNLLRRIVDLLTWWLLRAFAASALATAVISIIAAVSVIVKTSLVSAAIIVVITSSLTLPLALALTLALTLALALASAVPATIIVITWRKAAVLLLRSAISATLALALALALSAIITWLATLTWSPVALRAPVRAR
ncbi:hypothetical protein D3C74_263580 [compost metagenome]